MSQKRLISNKNEYLRSFDRIFIAGSFFKKTNAPDLINQLISAGIANGAVVLSQATITSISNQTQLVGKLKDSGLLRLKPNTTSIVVLPTTYKVAAKNLSSKNYKLLLITDDDNEGFDFKKLDYDDNHINDIQACCFDGGGSLYQYDYIPPKEDICFKIKTTEKCERVNVLFFKSLAGGSFEELQPKGSSNLAKTSDGQRFTYVIDKAELFESDKVAFRVKTSNGELQSPKMDFFFGDAQNWGITVYSSRINCELIKEEDDKTETVTTEQNDSLDTDGSNEPTENEKYQYYGGQKVNLPTDVDISVNYPEENQVVYTKSGKSVKLVKKLGEGGEGIVYSTNVSGMVVKILNNKKGHNLTKNKKEKIEAMVAKPMNHPNVIWPKETVYTSNKEFVGFMMQSAHGTSLYTFVMQAKKGVGFGVYDVTKEKLIQMILSILDTMVYLHKRNVILGDIKLENFMIMGNDVTRVYFVDCDSYQVGKFPATKVSPGFIPPELSKPGTAVDKVYRTYANEYYAIFALLFHILLKGKTPYCQIGQDAPEVEKAKMGVFPYWLDKKKTEDHAPPLTRVCWSHLPGYVKSAFYNVGSCKGSKFGEDKRMKPDEWYRVFESYLKDIRNGRLKADLEYNVTIPDFRKGSIDYSIVDIQSVSKITQIQKEFALSSAIAKAYKKANISFNSNLLDVVTKQLRTSANYSDKNINITLKKNLGILFEIEYTYLG